MFPKEDVDMHILLSRYDVPTWSTLKCVSCERTMDKWVDLYLGVDRSKPIASFRVDVDEFRKYETVNTAYRDLKQYLDTHFKPRRTRVVDEFLAPEA